MAPKGRIRSFEMASGGADPIRRDDPEGADPNGENESRRISPGTWLVLREFDHVLAD